MMSTIVLTHARRVGTRRGRAGGGSDIMRVTIIKRPHCTIHEFHFTGWRVGETYDVSFEIASLLIVEGCAQLEMRAGSDRRRAKREEGTERRNQRVG